MASKIIIIDLHIGDVVQLKSGELKMTISAYYTKMDQYMVSWFDGNSFIEALMPLTSLIRA